jgi:hypothetical protein
MTTSTNDSELEFFIFIYIPYLKLSSDNQSASGESSRITYNCNKGDIKANPMPK